MNGSCSEFTTQTLHGRLSRRRVLRLLGAGLATAAGLTRIGPVSAVPGGPPIHVSGGGWFLDTLIPSGPPIRGRITFGFQVHEVPPNPVVPPNPIRGTLAYHDPDAGISLTSEAIETLELTGESSARFSGIGRLGQGTSVAFRVELTAGTAPAFAIAIDGAVDPTGEGTYARGGAVEGGQITLAVAIGTDS